MKARRFQQATTRMLGVLLALTAGNALEVEARGRGEHLEGTWLVQVTLVNCATGAPLPIPGNPFPSVRSYTGDGTMLNSPATPPPVAPTATQSLGVGSWKRIGANLYRARFLIFRHDAAGAHIGTEEITIERELIRGGPGEPDEVVGAGHLKVFSPSGVLIQEGCNQDEGRRFTARMSSPAGI